MSLTIRQARLLSGKTQKEMAESLGICRHTYIKYESQPDTVPIGYAKQISKITCVPVDDIFFAGNSTLRRI